MFDHDVYVLSAVFCLYGVDIAFDAGCFEQAM